MASGSLSGALSPGRMSVDDRIGSRSSSSSACTTGWSGTRNPMVRRLGLIYRKDKALSKAALGFIQIVLDNVGEELGTAKEKPSKVPRVVA